MHRKNPSYVVHSLRQKLKLKGSGQPGVYSAVAQLRPWLQMEELTTSLRLVASIAK